MFLQAKKIKQQEYSDLITPLLIALMAETSKNAQLDYPIV